MGLHEREQARGKAFTRHTTNLRNFASSRHVACNSNGSHGHEWLTEGYALSLYES